MWFFLRNILKKITADDPIARLAKAVFEKKTGKHSEGIPVPIFDPLATMVAVGGLHEIQVEERYLDVDLTQTEKDNRCGKIFVVEKGSRKIEIVQGVSQHEFGEDFAKIINRPMEIR